MLFKKTKVMIFITLMSVASIAFSKTQDEICQKQANDKELICDAENCIFDPKNAMACVLKCAKEASTDYLKCMGEPNANDDIKIWLLNSTDERLYLNYVYLDHADRSFFGFTCNNSGGEYRKSLKVHVEPGQKVHMDNQAGYVSADCASWSAYKLDPTGEREYVAPAGNGWKSCAPESSDKSVILEIIENDLNIYFSQNSDGTFNHGSSPCRNVRFGKY